MLLELRATNDGSYPGKLFWAVSADGISDVNVVSVAAPGAAAWHHVACGYDGTNIFLSLNAATKVTTALASVFDSTAAFIFGAETSLAYPLRGALCDWGYWHKALSADEITALYNSGNGNPLIHPTGALA
jgi:hypothetical protein